MSRAARYIDVITRPVGQMPALKWCVVDDQEMEKCRMMSKVAFSRGVRPEISCVGGNSSLACMAALRDGEADMAVMDPEEVYLASRWERNEGGANL